MGTTTSTACCDCSRSNALTNTGERATNADRIDPMVTPSLGTPVPLSSRSGKIGDSHSEWIQTSRLDARRDSDDNVPRWWDVPTDGERNGHNSRTNEESNHDTTTSFPRLKETVLHHVTVTDDSHCLASRKSPNGNSMSPRSADRHWEDAFSPVIAHRDPEEPVPNLKPHDMNTADRSDGRSRSRTMSPRSADRHWAEVFSPPTKNGEDSDSQSRSSSNSVSSDARCSREMEGMV